MSAVAAVIPGRSRILVVDDHHILLDGLSLVLAPRYETSCINSLTQLEFAVATFRPDVVLLDISLPDGDGVSAAQQLLRKYPALRVIFLSMHAEEAYMLRAARAGAHGFVGKKARAEELLATIETVLKDGQSQPMSYTPASCDSATPPPGLTERQKEVLRLVARGFSAKEIATELNISVRTAEFHRGSIMHRLGLHSTALVTRYAMETGLV